MGASFRRTLHFAEAGLLYHTGALSFWRFLRRATVREQTCVLGLHRVLTSAEWAGTNSLDGMVLSEATFERLLTYLQQNFDVVSLEEFLASRREPNRSTTWRCLLTFDDGWGDTYNTAYRLLKKFRMPAVVFVATGSLGGKGGFWVEQINGVFKNPAMRAHLESVLHGVLPLNGIGHNAEEVIEWLKHMPASQRNAILKRLLSYAEAAGAAEKADATDAMMTWGQTVEMSHDGMEMGGHTVTHPLLTYEDESTVERELRLSKGALEQQTGARVRSFAYPNGDWDERIRRQTEQAGYECAFTTHPGWYCSGQDRYAIPRILLHEGNITGRDGQFSPAMFHLALAGRV